MNTKHDEPKAEAHAGDNSQFLIRLKEEIDRGFSITPFLGSGVSAPSGILMGQDFDDYLTFVIYRVLQSDGWDLRNRGWPPKPSSKEMNAARKEIREMYSRTLHESYGCIALSGNEDDQQVVHVVTDRYDVKVLALKRADEQMVPESGQRLILIYNVANAPIKEHDNVKIRIFGVHGSRYPDIPLQELKGIGEHNDKLLTQFQERLKSLWNQDLPDRTKYDLATTILALAASHPQHRRFFEDLEDRMPIPEAHKLSLQMKRPLVPQILRSSRLREEESQFEQMRHHWGIKDEPSEPNQTRSSRAYIEDAALRSMSHWTRMLEFLSQVRPGVRVSAPWLDKPNSGVIDSFNAHITRDRHPNLIHNLIARLSRSLRMRLLLTTNFDSLIEQSFRAQGEPLHVLPVSIKGGLPAYATVRAQDCLVKLHGDLLETRADSSINDPPGYQDRKRFYQYLRGYQATAAKSFRDVIPSHLLVIGYSANDARCVQMIKFVLDLDEAFHLFWVCYSQDDLKIIDRLFKDYKNRLTFAVTDRADLLLWELYQKLNLTLPGGGYSFQFGHLVPPRPKVLDNESEPTDNSKTQLENLETTIGKKLIPVTHEVPGGDQSAEESNGEPNQNPAVIWIDSKSGVAQRLSAYFYHLQKKRARAIWLELEDFACATHLLAGIFRSIAMRSGHFQLEWFSFPTDGAPNPADQAERIRTNVMIFVEKYGVDASEWTIFLYGRNGPGGCCGWSLSYWTEEHYKGLNMVLEVLHRIGFRVIYMAFGEQRALRNHDDPNHKDKTAFITRYVSSLYSKPAAGALNDDYKAWSSIAWGNIPLDRNPVLVDTHDHISDPNSGRSPETRFIHELPKEEFERIREGSQRQTYEETVKKVTEAFCLIDADGDNQSELLRRLKAARMLWLYGITLFRQSRHSAALLSEAVFPCPFRFEHGKDNDEIRRMVLFGIDEAKSNNPDLAEEWVALIGDHKDFEPERLGWVNWLESRDLLLSKPGGYTWKYRDTRLGIQYVLEQSPHFLYYRKGISWTSESGKSRLRQAEPRELDSIWRLRGRIHFWIGEWYMRAFHSTLHHLPLLETIYHSIQCMLQAPYYQQPLRGEDSCAHTGDNEDNALTFTRFRLAWRALCQLRRAVADGAKSLQFWMPGVDIEAIHFHGLGEDIDKSIDCIKQQMKKEILEKMKSRPALIERMNNGLNTLAVELKELRLTVLSEGRPHKQKALAVGSAFLGEGKGFARIIPVAHTTETIDSDSEWLRTEVEEALAGLLSESNNGDSARFCEVFASVGGASNLDQTVRGFRQDWLTLWAKDEGPELWLFQLSNLISEASYRVVRRAKLLLYSSESGYSDSSGEHLTLWKNACALCNLALNLIYHLGIDGREEIYQLRIQILTRYGMALGYLGRFKESHRRFNEAHALLVAGLRSLERKELAKIHLRRAEMLLARAHYLVKPPDEDEGGEGSQHIATIRPIVACIDDAWAALERANLSMTGTNHSGFWWYRLVVCQV